MDLNSFMIMGGHGLYVWSAYGCALLILVYNLISPIIARKRILFRIKQQIRVQQGRERTVRSSITSTSKMPGHTEDKPAVERSGEQ